MHFSAKCNSGRIAIQWFHIKHYLDYQYTKFQPYTFRVQKMCVFARYATLVPRLFGNDKDPKVQTLQEHSHCILQTTRINESKQSGILSKGSYNYKLNLYYLVEKF